MPNPELGLAAFDTGVECINIAIYIIRTAQNVRALKGECAETAKIAKILKDVLDKNPDALKESETAARLKTLLDKLARFVTDCQSSSIFHLTWEVTWKHQLPSLLKQLMTWVAYFTLQATVLTRSDLLELLTKSDDIQETNDRIESSLKLVLSRLEILEEMKKELDEAKPPNLEVTFSETDIRVSVIQQEGEDSPTGTLSIGEAESINIVCIPIQEGLMRFGQKGPRYALIYERLSANTLVHPYYGVAQRYGRLWAVMKDMRDVPSLRDALVERRLPDEFLKRLEIAHIISKTVAYLHSVDVLVKRLSDTSVLLSTEGSGVLTPYLTSLERARLFQEWTSGGEYDVRYEAPEFHGRTRAQHSVATDIWSLGFLIWQCVSQMFPHGFTEEITEGPDAAAIRAKVKQGILPWRSKQADPQLAQLSSLVGSCCAERPDDRPSAAEVEHSLFQMISRASTGADLVPLADISSKARAANLLAQVERGNASQSPRAVSETLTDNDVHSLSILADGGDSLAALHLGRAFLTGLATPKDDNDLLVLASMDDIMKSTRLRAAVPYLEFALQASYKSAAKPLMKAHRELAKLYKAQHQRFKEMNVLYQEPNRDEI